MPDATAPTAAAGATAFTPVAHPSLLAQALGRVLAGEPLPDELRPAAAAVARPASVREGIERILVGHCPRAA